MRLVAARSRDLPRAWQGSALPARLTDAQARQALDPLLKQIDQTTDREVLKALAQTLDALAAKLLNAQAEHASGVAGSSLAWAASEDEAADWARALVPLSARLSDEDAAKPASFGEYEYAMETACNAISGIDYPRTFQELDAWFRTNGPKG